MKLAIIGSRNFDDYDLLCEVLEKYRPQIKMIISGGARGADKLAARYAADHGIEIEEYIPDWSTGMGAGHARNTLIIDACDRVVAFWDMVSAGTKDSIKKAKAKDKPIEVVNYLQYQPPLDFA